MGYCYLEAGRVHEAIPHLKKAVRTRRHSAGLRLLGYALAEAGEAAEAITLYQEALNRNPESHETHLLLAVTFQQLGEEKLALPHFNKARELIGQDPRTPSQQPFRLRLEQALEVLGNGEQIPFAEGQ